MSLSKLYLYILLIFSILGGISGTQLFSAWVMMELNMLVFLFILYIDQPMNKWSSLTQYFFVQSIASILILWVLMLLTFSSSTMMTLFLVPSIMLKLGAFPAHVWYINIIGMLSWDTIFLLSTLQKLLPLFVLSSLVSLNLIFFMSILSMVAAIFIQNQTLIKKMIGYSSIFNMSWMLILPGAMMFNWVFFLYAMVMGLICWLFTTISPYMNEIHLLDYEMSAFFIIAMMRIAGIPPTIGFWLKVMVVFALAQELGLYGLSMLFLLMSLFTLVAYMNIALSVVMYEKTYKLAFIQQSGKYSFTAKVIWLVAPATIFIILAPFIIS